VSITVLIQHCCYLHTNRDQVQAIAELLLKKETINHDDMVATIGARPFSGHKAYEDYIHSNLMENREQSEKEAAENAAKNTDIDENDKQKTAAADVPPNLTPA
jgi:hypothetical protein